MEIDRGEAARRFVRLLGNGTLDLELIITYGGESACGVRRSASGVPMPPQPTVSS